MRKQIAHIDLKPTMEMLAREGIMAPFSMAQITESDCALLIDILDTYARVYYNLRLALGVRTIADESYTVPVTELNDTDLFAHALKLFESLKDRRAEYGKGITALAVMTKNRHLRHTIAHWLIRRSPLGDILVFFSTDIKQSVKQRGGDWAVERHRKSQDTSHAAARVADLWSVLTSLREAADAIGIAAEHLMGSDA